MKAEPAAAIPGAVDRDLPVAIVTILAAMAILPVMDGFAKFLGATVPILVITWARFTFHTAVILPAAIIRHGPRRVFRPANPIYQVARSILLVVSTLLFFASLRHLPLADALALIFINPIVVTVFAPLWLGEHVGLRRWIAVLVGFAGTLIIVRPGFAEFNIGTAYALCAGFAVGAYFLVTRRLSGSAEPLVTLAYTGLVGAAATTCMLPAFWVTPTLPEFGMLACIGLIAACGHYLIIRAYDRAPAPVLAPFGYAEMIMATVVGYIGFGDIPDRWTILGVAILIASGLYISMRERVRHAPGADQSPDAAV